MIQAMGDEELAARTAGGDREAFASLYERYFQGVYDFAVRITRNEDVAADVVQNTFVKAWEQLRRRNIPQNVKAWLYTVARNAAIDELRHRKRLVAADEVEAEAEDRYSPYPEAMSDRPSDPEAILQDKELVDLVWSSTAALSPEEYSLLDLHLRKGLSVDELAASLGVRKGALYTRLSRLKDALEESVISTLLVRRGRRDCPELDALLSEHQATALTRDIHRAVQMHLHNCPRCQESKRRYASPVAIFSSLALIPSAPSVQGAIWQGISSQIGSGAVGGGNLIQRTIRQGFQATGATAAVAVGTAAIAVIGLLAGQLRVEDPRDAHSPTHVIGQPSSNNVIAIVWSRQPNAVAFSLLWSEGPRDLPDTTVDLPGSATEAMSPPLPEGAWYFHLRTQGRLGQWTSTLHLGPFLIRPPEATPQAAEASAPTPIPGPTNIPASVPISTLAPPTSTSPPTSTQAPTPTYMLTQPTGIPASTNTPTAIPTSTNTPAYTPINTPKSVPPNPPTGTPTPTYTPAYTSTNPPTSTLTSTPASTHMPTPTNTPTGIPTLTSTPTGAATLTPMPTACPPLTGATLTATVNPATNVVTVEGDSTGGCHPFNGTVTAQYEGEPTPYATHIVRRPSGRLIDRPPVRCQGTFTIIYTLTLYDGSGQSVTATTTAQVTWRC